MNLVRASLLLAALMVAGCAPYYVLLTDAEISTSGTKSFDAPMPKVFEAAVKALKAQGFELAEQNGERGTILTVRKVVKMMATGNERSATAEAVSRQYLLEVSERDGHTLVVARPRLFVAEREVSSVYVWHLEGAEGERALWAQLFSQIRELL